MGVLDQNIELFTYRSQVKITELGGQMLSDDLNGLCIDKYIDLIDQLDSAIYLLQNATDDMSDNEKEEVMSYLYDKANLNPLPLPLYRQCGCNSPVSVTGGYIPVPGATGATGPQGEQGIKGDTGNDGVDGEDGLNGWTSVQSIVADGSREVVKISDWIGGTGNKPTALPVYIGSTGFVTSISQAVNIKGSAGPAGPTGNTGATGPSGASAYVYTAYADADDGTGYTLTFNASKYYIAIITTTAPITPTESDFTGKWFKWKGEVGPALNINERGLLSDRHLYDNEAQDFIFFSIDTNEIYIKDTGLPGDWSDPIPFGGNQGWSPIISVHQDGDRVVLYVGGWVGGQGTYPSASGYVSGSGLTNNISLGIDIRGTRGKRFYPDAQDTISNISIYNDAPQDYVFYATDEGKVYVKQTSLSGDWSIGYVWRGPQGPQGPAGPQGNGQTADCRLATTTALNASYPVGPELTNDPTFTTGGTWWEGGPSPFTTTSGSVDVASKAGDNISTGTFAVNGRTYLIEIIVDSNSGDGDLRSGGSELVGTMSSPGTYSFIYTKTSSFQRFGIIAQGSSFVVSKFSVKEVSIHLLVFNSDGVISIDSINPNVNDRILVKNQTNSYENGLWVVLDTGSVSSPGILARATDFDTTLEIKKFKDVFITDGVVNGGTIWFLLTRIPITLGTSKLFFAKVDNTALYLYRNSDGTYPKAIYSNGNHIVVGDLGSSFDTVDLGRFIFSSVEQSLSTNEVGLWVDNYKIIKKDAGSSDLGVLGHYIITDSTIIDEITDGDNWTGSEYTGPGISDVYSGQYYYDDTYFYFMVTNTVPVRMARA